jgi:hypothetical protein
MIVMGSGLVVEQWTQVFDSGFLNQSPAVDSGVVVHQAVATLRSVLQRCWPARGSVVGVE